MSNGLMPPRLDAARRVTAILNSATLPCRLSRGIAMQTIRATFAALLVSLCIAPAAQAQPWPSRPVKLIAPYAAGGAADKLGRIIAEPLSRTFHQQCCVENRGGGGGLIGANAVASAEPDGATFVISGIASMVVAPAISHNPGFDTMKDFTHISSLGGPPVVFIVHPSLG